MDVRKTCILLLLISGMAIELYAQQSQRVSGQIWSMAADAKEKESLPYASVLVINEKDSTLVKGTTSNANGKFSLRYPAYKDKRYLLKVSYTGMQPVFHKLTENVPDIHLENIILKEGIELDEVTVTAQVREIEQIGDTTIINASAYKTPEGSYLEDLVKRIPGLEYNSKDKTLVYNGLPITEINVNGEAFFSGNNSLALENLPVELINKIKVYDKKSDLEKTTGVSSGKENYVLDLQTKKEFNSTLLASGKAGLGNYNKKDLELLGNYFKKGGENLSLIVRSGNRNMTTSYKDNIQDNIALNFVKRFGKNLTINGNTTYNHNNNGNKSAGYYEQYLSTGNKYQYSAGESTNRNHTINSMLALRWQINEKTFVSFSGNLNSGRGNNTNNNRQAAFDENPNLETSDPFGNIGNIPDDMRLNDITMNSLSTDKRLQYTFNANITRQINRKGSSLSLMAQYSDSKGKNESFTISSTTYYRLENSLGNDSVLYRNQYQRSPNGNRNQNIGLIFTHPFTKKVQMQLSYNLNYSKQQSDRNTYNLSGLTDETTDPPGYLPPQYETGYTDSLSNRSHSRTLGHEVSFHINYSTRVWNIVTGLSIQPEQRSLDQKTGLRQADTTMYSVGFRPTFTILWKKGKSLIRLNYRGDTRQPSLPDLLSLTDNSDPLNITRGNPDLKPSYSQSVRLEAQNIRKGIFATLNWQNEVNSQTRTITYNRQTGGRESYPVNINGNWNIHGTLRYQKRIRSFNISAVGGGSFIQNVGLINEGESEQPDHSTTHNTGLNANLRLGYFPKWGSIDLNGNWRFQHSSNSLRQTNTYTRNYSLGFNAYADLPGNIQLKTDATYTFRNGTNIRQGEDDQIVWNTGITWRFLKKKQAELSVYWADILNQKKNYSRSTTSSGFSEHHTQQIGSYFIISMKYRFNRPLHKQ